MLATFNSRDRASWRLTIPGRKWKMFTSLCHWCLAGWLGVLIALSAPAQIHSAFVKPLDGSADFASQFEKVYQAAKIRHEAQTNNPEAAWQFGQACYDWADCAKSDSQREEIATEGINACRALVKRDSQSAAGHYYLGMDLGQLAETKNLGALKIVTEMETEFKTALSLDPGFDYAGPDRNLGLLYHQAPGWPVSIGSKSKARQHLQKALKLAPDYPENILNLVEAELDWGEKGSALRELKALDELWTAARSKFTGDKWAPSWADWVSRREHDRKKATQPAPAVETPHKMSGN